MLIFILKTIWLLLPAVMANMSPVIFKWVPFLDYPVDFKINLNKKRIFGQNKTFRGFFFGILSAILVVFLQKHFFYLFKTVSLLDYKEINVVLLGFLFGFGALFGDLVKSFLKRRKGIKPGVPWIPYDQIDWILGALFFMSFYITIPYYYYLSGIIILGALHPVVNLMNFKLGIQESKL
jgi:CDP-2,3-bis-(O-geranylgeranyl)-sn-glycerol synthase